MADGVALKDPPHAPQTWAQFWERVPLADRCTCGDADCGLALYVCPGCLSPQQMFTRVMAHRPVVQLLCKGCNGLIEEWALIAGGA